MKYMLLKTDKFIDQLTDILIYLKDAFSMKEASVYLTYVEHELTLLSEFPDMGSVPRFQPIAKQGFRALVLKQNILFYKVNEADKTIVLHIIVSSKQNYLNLI